ncbi:uncharacterized protein LOC104897410 [Beta vulgaris subsp. vulgaris]|uniref:uncharacterized protein LOC104897410 n=1 Tax=Beta vulgaris subsp. vulgaris TaxID=3555 RepID=UPI00254793D5|nr:uncharacterized protein LOC104897410 [Beta vulgaris subsp. vulgaris]
MKIPEVKDLISELLVPPLGSYIMYDFDGNDLISYDVNDARRRVFRFVFELFPLYLIVLPLIELFSSTIIINIAAKICTGNMESVANHYIVTNGFDYDTVTQKGLIINFMSAGFHAVIFLALLNKYLDWSVSWNMGMVISVLEGENGIDALELSAYYGKHCKQIGFRLMLVFFVYSVALRIPFVLVSMCNYVNVRIVVTVGLVCLGSLVKWVALVLYFYDCKAQVWLKKDDEVGEAVKTDDLC